MQPRVDLITVATDDLAASRTFYVDGLGWTPTLEVPGEIIFLQANRGLLLALWDAEALADDMGMPPGSVLPGAGFSLSHNVASAAEVDAVLNTARAAGGTILKYGHQADFGGYSGYFADPAGIRWEIAYNPAWRVREDGSVELGLIE
ncbi:MULTISPECIES: VOC family protein [unclassified Salinibacterium]|uniref:VOC family protein n=1 Tax=unclassified Salinibacterium TaxID=2632331 RepID=UPI0014238DC1|nr:MULTISPECIES: VOC family protein [unclassified Salinibacterium]